MSENDLFQLLKADKTELIVVYIQSETYAREEIYTKSEYDALLDIATSKSKAYVFLTQKELNDWMAIQNNVAELVVRDNLYIVVKEVTDYWWDGTDLKVLETELLDRSNVITTLGATTGSCNAITDLSIDGNTLTPVKSITFVTTGFDQSITGMKTFTSTIIFNGIQYSEYNNNTVFLAGGGVKAISDINASVGLSNCYNKAQIYSQTETNNLIINMSDVEVSYTKSEDDELLLLKADKTQLIESCSRSETYAKDEVFTKTETNNLLNYKANQSTTYSKSETYARDEVYSKTETDQLI
ncbi:MAG: hypothetical protein EZS28_006153 [Streblomastix strix]|uniref:Uncharacterized protein n=1 Tax=Streblomastix strix TaxID=222440 RepID=A0A5J4WU55_9EUKA|nr:MAG: hypothetical protein EZS28_006153 [Streblomastix strix]